MKKTFTWWVGWIVLWPFRYLFLIILCLASASVPNIFFPLLNIRSEDNPDNWHLK